MLHYLTTDCLKKWCPGLLKQNSTAVRGDFGTNPQKFGKRCAAHTRPENKGLDNKHVPRTDFETSHAKM